MEFNNKENEKVVLQDGRTVWLSRACAIVNTVWCVVDGVPKLLIGQRGPGCPDEVGSWNLPCGYLDWDESLKEAAERETWEETGVDIKNIEPSDILLEHMNSPWLITSSKGSDAKQNVSMHHAIIFKAESYPELTDENSEPGEIGDLKWVTKEEVTNYKYAFNHLERINDFVDNVDLAVAFI